MNNRDLANALATAAKESAVPGSHAEELFKIAAARLRDIPDDYTSRTNSELAVELRQHATDVEGAISQSSFRMLVECSGRLHQIDAPTDKHPTYLVYMWLARRKPENQWDIVSLPDRAEQLKRDGWEVKPLYTQETTQ